MRGQTFTGIKSPDPHCSRTTIMASIIGALLVPSGLAYVLFVLGLLACLRERWRCLSWGLLAASGAITLVCSSGAVATALMSPLEYEHPAVHDIRAYPN